MKIVLVKPYNSRPVGEVLDVGVGVAKVLIGRKFAKEYTNADDKRRVSKNTVDNESQDGSSNASADSNGDKKHVASKRGRRQSR